MKMGAMVGGVVKLIQFLQVVFFYGMMAAVIYMLYKLQKEIGEVKNSITELHETVALLRLPREADRDRAPQL
jgi:hypothetical protein